MAIHFAVVAGVIWGKWLETPPIFHATKPKERLATVRLLAAPKTETDPEVKDIAQIFVPVDPNIATEQAPKETENYSNANSLAANPKTGTTQIPNLKGEQTIERRAHADDASAASQQLANKPAPAKPQSARPLVAPIIKPKKPTPRRTTPPSIAQSGEAGSLAPLQPFNPPDFSSSIPQPNPKLNERRPPSLAEAQSKLGNGTIAGRPSTFDGGVQRKGPHALDVRLTGFGEYDARFIATIKAKWYKLLETRKLRYPGTVIVDFVLHADGRITDMKVRQNTITNTAASGIQEYCCRQSIRGSALFESWPDVMRRKLKTDSRNCRITFSYLIQ
ncbi:MAG: hypothetical protein H8E27_04740 [Verrucomicrobia subdivision 3 bacterium]|nr:hypothetical protein [Limisphaerales bacterium]